MPVLCGFQVQITYTQESVASICDKKHEILRRYFTEFRISPDGSPPPKNVHFFKAGFDCQHVIDFKITGHRIIVDIVD
jgi:hypothetical protein